jgi:pyruvate,water dikinase
MGVPSKLINQHDSTFRNMLGLVNGRVYYNLRNWYHMLFLFPASSKSNKFMETMMGVKQGLNPEMEQMFEFTKNPPNYNPLHRLWILTVNAYRIFNTKKIIAKFKSDFEIIYQAGLETNYSEMNIQELISYYNYLNVEFVGRWKAPIISDTRCMIFFGVLKALCDKWLSDIDNKNLFNDLLAGQELPSSEPTLRLIEIAETLRNHFPDKTDWFINSSNQIVLESIKNYELPEVSTRFYEFIKLYGFRCVDELKLESIDLHEDSSFAIEAIRNFLKNPNISSHEILKREKHKAQLAETTIYNELSFLKRKIILFFTALTKNAVKDREDLRLLRTNSFGLCRKIFKNLGDRFYKLNLINQPSDIFFLAVDEIINYCEGRSFETDLKLLINVRREQYQQYEELSSPPDRFVTRGITGANFYYHQTLEDLLALDDVVSTDPNYLHGTACSPGVVEGVVRVVFNIEQATNLNGEILVCERTDPGWVPLFPSCSALIVERGSLLSHSAVVARELGIPTIVGVRGGVMKRLKTGMRIRMNGGNGDIFILQE